MDLTAIHRYRLAVFLDYNQEPLRRMRVDNLMGLEPGTPGRSEHAVDLLIEVAGGGEPGSKGYAASIAASYLNLTDEIGLLRAGAMMGYYSKDAFEQVIASVADPGGASFTDFIQRSTQAYWIELDRYEWRDTAGEYVRLLAEWRDTQTSDFRRCVELVLFAGDEEWEVEFTVLSDLLRALRADPSLWLSTDRVDQLGWALTGAIDLLEPSGSSPIDWSLVWALFQEARARVDQLTSVRTAISQFDGFITADESAAATERLRRSRGPSSEFAD
jgi:hypothetical protein